MNLFTSQKKRDFLEACGFKMTYEAEPHKSMLGKYLATMEGWTKIADYGMVKLYIHFNNDPEDPHFCELYDGGEGEGENFSERNLISELKKRGFQPLEEEE